MVVRIRLLFFLWSKTNLDETALRSFVKVNTILSHSLSSHVSITLQRPCGPIVVQTYVKIFSVNENMPKTTEKKKRYFSIAKTNGYILYGASPSEDETRTFPKRNLHLFIYLFVLADSYLHECSKNKRGSKWIFNGISVVRLYDCDSTVVLEDSHTSSRARHHCSLLVHDMLFVCFFFFHRCLMVP